MSCRRHPYIESTDSLIYSEDECSHSSIICNSSLERRLSMLVLCAISHEALTSCIITAQYSRTQKFVSSVGHIICPTNVL